MFDRIRQFRALVHNPQATKADLATFAALAQQGVLLEGVLLKLKNSRGALEVPFTMA